MMKAKILPFILLFSTAMALGQETYSARVVDGPNFAADLFHVNEKKIVGQVPHLHSLDIDFGLANWYWTTQPSVAAATSYINVELDIDYKGFTMTMPNGGYKKVSLEEAGINISGYAIVNIKLDIEFGKIGARATAEIDFSGSFGQLRKGSGSVRFVSKEDEAAFIEFTKFDHEKKRYLTVHEIFTGLNQQVSISHRGSYNGTILSDYATFGLGQINKYIQKIWVESEKEIQFNTQLADAQNAESFGRKDDAIQKYEEAYKIKQDPAVKAKIEALKAQKQTEVEEAAKKAETEAKTSKETEPDKDGMNEDQTTRDQEVVDNFDHTIPKEQLSTELDFWGNPVISKSENGEDKTVSYAGTEVENNEHYQQQMAIRRDNEIQRQQFEEREAQRKSEIEARNNAIYQQVQIQNDNLFKDLDEMDKAKEQLNYSSGDALLRSSSELAQMATATNNVGQGKTALIGMGVGAIMKIGEGAAKRKAAEKAREERERQRKAEEARIKAAKEVMKKGRLSVFKAFPAAELPLSSTKSSGDNLYYFVYAYDDLELTRQDPTVFLSNTFAIGKYPDGTWPMKTKVGEQINTLTPQDEIICGPFYSQQEAEQVIGSFKNYLNKASMAVKTIEYIGYNAHDEGSPATVSRPKVDVWGNPIEGEIPKTQIKENSEPDPSKPKLDMWGNPIKN